MKLIRTTIVDGKLTHRHGAVVYLEEADYDAYRRRGKVSDAITRADYPDPPAPAPELPNPEPAPEGEE